jgi:uncharacterized membrane protein
MSEIESIAKSNYHKNYHRNYYLKNKDKIKQYSKNYYIKKKNIDNNLPSLSVLKKDIIIYFD